MFKVGDWVKVKGTLESDIFKLTENEIKYKEIILGHFIFEENTWTHWQPKEGEWCWVFDDELRSELTNRAYVTSDGVIKTHDSCKWKYCEPFIGELPSFIKDNK